MVINDIVLGGGIGALLAVILALPALVYELGRKSHSSGSHILLPDVHTFLGRKLQDREVLSLGLLIHIVAGTMYGVIFPWTVLLGIWNYVEPYSVWSHVVFGFGAWLALALIVFPILGFGIMGRREDEWMWLEVLVTTAIMSVMFAVVINWFQPSWFLA